MPSATTTTTYSTQGLFAADQLVVIRVLSHQQVQVYSLQAVDMSPRPMRDNGWIAYHSAAAEPAR
jgi:hypothetical protein